MDEQEEGREMDESITKELRDFTFYFPHLRGVADRIDARFDRELTAKREEVDGLKADNADLQARLDASILPPVDIDGARWTGEDVDKPFAYGGVIPIVFSNDQVLREIVYDWPHEGWWLVDQYDTHYPADKCRHVAPEPPETIEDVRKSCDNTVSYLASVSGMGWHDVETFSKDVHKQLDRAYSCGKRDGAGIEASRLHHVAPEPPEPTDSQERIDADARKVSCDYFGRSTGWCNGCPAENGGDCATIKALDLLRRQRELDGAGGL